MRDWGLKMGPWLDLGPAQDGDRDGGVLLGTGWLDSQVRTCTWLEMEVWPVPAFDHPILGPRYLTSTFSGGGLKHAAKVPRTELRTRPSSMGPEGG